jgi:hypothetical protein
MIIMLVILMIIIRKLVLIIKEHLSVLIQDASKQILKKKQAVKFFKIQIVIKQIVNKILYQFL